MPNLLDVIEANQMRLKVDIVKVRRSMCKITWYWQLSDIGNDFIVCRSCNFKDINNPGDYSSKATAVKSAKRFVSKYLKRFNNIFIEDENGRVIG